MRKMNGNSSYLVNSEDIVCLGKVNDNGVSCKCLSLVCLCVYVMKGLLLLGGYFQCIDVIVL